MVLDMHGMKEAENHAPPGSPSDGTEIERNYVKTEWKYPAIGRNRVGK